METYSLLKDALVAPICLCGLLDLLFRGIRVHDAVLATDLLPVPLLVILLDALVLVELGFEESLEALQLLLLRVARAVGGARRVALEALDAILDGGVLDLRLGDVALELLGRLAVCAAERPLVELRDGVDVRREAPYLVAEALHAVEELLLGVRCGCGGLLGAVSVVAVAVILQFILVVALRIGIRLAIGILLSCLDQLGASILTIQRWPSLPDVPRE